MSNLLKNFFINHQDKQSKLQLFLAFGFTLFTIIALGIDSVFFTNRFFDARIITNVAVIGYFSLLFYLAATPLRKLMFIMVFLSYIGELIFCKLFGMYAYRTEYIPLYVPFGHAIVYASGYIFAHSNCSIVNEKKLHIGFMFFFVTLFVGVGIYLNDIFSLLFGILFFVLLKRKRWQNLYCFIALCVIFIELAGTFFGCWTWAPKIFGLIPAANPPMGAVFFYAGGDVLLVKIANYFEPKNKN